MNILEIARLQNLDTLSSFNERHFELIQFLQFANLDLRKNNNDFINVWKSKFRETSLWRAFGHRNCKCKLCLLGWRVCLFIRNIDSNTIWSLINFLGNFWIKKRYLIHFQSYILFFRFYKQISTIDQVIATTWSVILVMMASLNMLPPSQVQTQVWKLKNIKIQISKLIIAF